MAKEKPSQLEPLEKDTIYKIKQITEGWMYKNQWIIYAQTKFGEKWFQVYNTEQRAMEAAKVHGLSLQIDWMGVNYL